MFVREIDIKTKMDQFKDLQKEAEIERIYRQDCIKSKNQILHHALYHIGQSFIDIGAQLQRHFEDTNSSTGMDRPIPAYHK